MKIGSDFKYLQASALNAADMHTESGDTLAMIPVVAARSV
jgi:hypothetical protein